MIKEDLLDNIEKIHTTKMGHERIKKNLKLKDDDVVLYCKSKIQDPKNKIYRKVKIGIVK